MDKQKTELAGRERRQMLVARNDQTIQSVSRSIPSVPRLNPLNWIQIDYRYTEIRLEGGEARIRSERKTFRDGVITEEALNAVAGSELYHQAVEQIRQQTEFMWNAMLLPWAGLMQPFFDHDKDRR